MRIATWNVNSLSVRLDQVLSLAASAALVTAFAVGAPVASAAVTQHPLTAVETDGSVAFTLTTDNTRPFDPFLEAHGLGDALTRYLIPARMVPRVRDQLDLVGMDERRLFPDIDGVAARIRRYYS